MKLQPCRSLPRSLSWVSNSYMRLAQDLPKRGWHSARWTASLGIFFSRVPPAGSDWAGSDPTLSCRLDMSQSTVGPAPDRLEFILDLTSLGQ